MNTVTSSHSPTGTSQPNPRREGVGLTAGLYVRVSTLNQVERDSLSTQESRLRAYCQANGFTVHKVYTDAGVSAKDTNRPALESLMEDCRRRKIQAVLVTALDRITRSLRDLIKLVDFFQQHNVRFISITQNIDSSSSFGRFMRDLLGLIARLEREVVAERVSGDMRHRALLGKWNGGTVPFGYTTYHRRAEELIGQGIPEDEARKIAGQRVPEPKKLYPDPEEAEVLKRIFETFIQTRSIRKTTHTLNSLGIKTRNGTAWAPSSVHRILANPLYIGRISYGKTRVDLETGKLNKADEAEWSIVKGQHQSLVPEGLFKQAQDILESTRQKPTRAIYTYLLSGILYCGKCGGKMHGYTFRNKGLKRIYRYYKCDNHTAKGTSVCTGMTVPANELDRFVVQTLADLSKDTVFLQDKEKMLAMLREEAQPQKRTEELEKLKRMEKDLDSRMETLLEKLESGLIDDLDFKKRYDKIKARLKENRLSQERISDSGEQESAAYEALNASFEEIPSFSKNWEFLDEQAKAAKISAIVKEIKVRDDKIEIQVYLDLKEVSREVSRRVPS